MQLLRRFYIIIIALVFVGTSSVSNISFKLNDDAGKGTSTIDDILLSVGSAFSSFLLQPISAQEQADQEAQQEEEQEQDSDVVMKTQEGQQQQRQDMEGEALEESENESSKEEEEGDEIKEEACPSGHNYDDKINSCTLNEEKEVCNDNRDNDSVSRVNSKDLNCLPGKDQTQEQQGNKYEQKDEDRLSGAEPSSYSRGNNSVVENPSLLLERLDNNSDTSSAVHDKTQDDQNLTDSSSSNTSTATTTMATTSNYTISSNGSTHYANSSAVQDNDSLSLKCPPEGAEMVPGAYDSITCTIENKTPNPIQVVLACAGLQETGIECYINEEYLTETILVKETSYTSFSVLLVSSSLSMVPAGSYPFTIRAENCINSDAC